MPLPKPRKNEKERDFISRCMGDEVMRREYEDASQRRAVCQSQWDRKKEASIMAHTHSNTTASREPPWASVDKTALPRIAYAHTGEAGKKSTWSYPHHWVSGGTKKDDKGIWVDGTLYLHRGGLNAAWQAANGARSGQTAPAHVIRPLQAHRRSLGLDKPRTALIDAIAASPWLITPEMLNTIIGIVEGGISNPDVIAATPPEKVTEDGVQIRGKVGIIDIIGPIFRYANLFTDISGATSLEQLTRTFDAALAEPSIATVILNIDSPGGQANGIHEFAEMIYQARTEKHIVAYVGGVGASAAYWLATAANELVIDDTGIVGSIGVVLQVQKKDDSKIEIVNSTSPMKRPDPEDDAGRKSIVELLDTLAGVFIENVARNRDVSVEEVQEKYGKGGLIAGAKAVTIGMADRLGSFESLVAEYGGNVMDIDKSYVAEHHPDVAEAFRSEGRVELKSKVMELEATITDLNEKLESSNNEIAAYKSKVDDLKKSNFLAKLTTKVGEERANELIGFYGRLEEEEILSLCGTIESLSKAVDDIGGTQGYDSVPLEEESDEKIEREISALAEELGVTVADAYVEWCKRNPDRVQ